MAVGKDTRSRTKSQGGTACVKAKPRPAAALAKGAGARKARIAQIRKEIRDGTYETEGKLRIAISRLIDDVLARCDKERR